MSGHADTLSRFADRLFLTGGTDPGDDALAIEPERLAVYHELVRRNYTSMLRFAYTMTFRLLAADAPDAPERIVCRFLEVSPASSHSTRHIADVFRTFFDSEYTDLIGHRPELPDLMTLERAELGALYAFDDPGRSPDDDELAALRQSAVDTFLALRIRLAPSATALRLAHRATEIHHRARHRDPPSPGEHAGAERVVVSRDPRTLDVRFTTLDEAPFRAVELLGPGIETTVERLAGAWLADLPDDAATQDDAWKLTTLAGTVFSGLHAGFLRL